MKIVSIAPMNVGFVTTDSQFYNQYQRVNGENWLQLIKDSWQGDCWRTVNMTTSRELELAYQEFLRRDDASLVLYGRFEPYKPGDVEGLGWTPHKGRGDTHTITLTQEDLKRLVKPIESSPPRS